MEEGHTLGEAGADGRAGGPVCGVRPFGSTLAPSVSWQFVSRKVACRSPESRAVRESPPGQARQGHREATMALLSFMLLLLYQDWICVCVCVSDNVTYTAVF